MHDHPQDEEISGDLSIGDDELKPGDFRASPADSRHSASTTPAGCHCIVVMAM
ncbi:MULTISPECIES: hypothetical protein [Methylosinus]|uniref:hypothetical protein n=1 Tax=Methylosinus TaxID=425 RepID=UPI000314B58E|nr:MULTISPECIES: hypothetical protein [Methylosinus]